MKIHHRPLGSARSTGFHYAPQPNWGFNADANIGHGFAIFMAYVGALQPSASGAPEFDTKCCKWLI